MIYTTLLSKTFRLLYGDPAEGEPGPGSGLVLVADGVGGLHLCGMALKHVMGEGEARHRVRLHSWGHGFGHWHRDLTNVANRDAQARAMAAEVLAWRAERPCAPAFLVGKSGGSGVVVRALEELPRDSVEAAVLLAPALSPGYDLTRALEAVRREMVVFWSPLDVFVLGLGTRVFGTIDRVRSVSAGLVGFRGDRAKLRQVRWRPAMMRTGYLGGHVGPDSPAFLRKYVVPLLRAETASDVGYPPRVKPGAGRADNPSARG
ncbi:MAG TPA: alpha/beta hydrolase [Isosphaeraceae bacterium]